MKKHQFSLKTCWAIPALLLHLTAAQADAQTQTSVYNFQHNVKQYAVENASDPFSGDTHETVWAGTIFDFGAPGNQAIHFMNVQPDGSITTNVYLDDPNYDDERVVDVVGNRVVGPPGTATYYIISLARHPQVGSPLWGNDEIRITPVDINGNLVGNSIIMTDNSQSVYPISAMYHSNGHIYICGYATNNYTNLPQVPSYGGYNAKKGLVMDFDPANPLGPAWTMGINTSFMFSMTIPTEDYDIAMRATELSNGNIHITGSVNDVKYRSGPGEFFTSATMNLVIDQALQVVSDDHFINRPGAYEYGMGMVEGQNGNNYIIGNTFSHNPGMSPFSGFDTEPARFWITHVDNNFTPDTTAGQFTRYSFGSFNDAWALQPLQSAGPVPAGSMETRFLIAGMQTGEHCTGTSIYPDSKPFLFDVSVDYTAAGGIWGNFHNWVTYENMTGTGGFAPNGYYSLGGGLSNWAWNPTFATRASTGNDIILSAPKWEPGSGLLNLKSVRADAMNLLEPNCPGSSTQYDGMHPCPHNFFNVQVKGLGYTPPPNSEGAVITKSYMGISIAPTISNPNVGSYGVAVSHCDQGNVNYKPSGIKNINSNNMLRVYPNPAKGHVTVKLPAAIESTADVRITLVNVYGQIVAVLYQGQASEMAQKLNIPSLPAGLYTLQAVAEGRVSGNVKLTIQP